MSGSAPTNTQPAPDGLPAPQRFWAVMTLLVSIGLSVLDASMANVALPTIAAEMGVSASSVVWVVNAYGLTVVVLLLPLSSVGERIGFKRLLKCGLILFVLAALGSALSRSLPMLIFFRVLQGVGGASVMCLFAALVTHIYPARLLARGIGINAMMVGVTSALGPALGAFILSFTDWHWVFAFNLPFSLLAFYGLRHIPNPAPTKNQFDWVAALLTIISIGLLVTHQLSFCTTRGVFACDFGWSFNRCGADTSLESANLTSCAGGFISHLHHALCCCGLCLYLRCPNVGFCGVALLFAGVHGTISDLGRFVDDRLACGCCDHGGPGRIFFRPISCCGPVWLGRADDGAGGIVCHSRFLEPLGCLVFASAIFRRMWVRLFSDSKQPRVDRFCPKAPCRRSWRIASHNTRVGANIRRSHRCLHVQLRQIYWSLAWHVGWLDVCLACRCYQCREVLAGRT